MTSVANRNRVQAGVPTGGEFATEQRGETSDLVVDPEAERDAAVDQILAMDSDDRDVDRVRQLIALDGITAKVNSLGTKTSKDGWEHFAYEVTLTNPRTGEKLKTPFDTGIGWKKYPDATDVLANAVDDAASFENCDSMDEWADNFGMDTSEPDGRKKAEKLWKRTEEAHGKLQTFLGDDYGTYVWGER